MTEFDTKYTYLGTIKLSGYELPKKIIELGDNLIVSLGEKKKKKKNKENLIKIKSILKIFKCNEQQDKNDEIMNDSDSINSMNSCSSWDSIFYRRSACRTCLFHPQDGTGAGAQIPPDPFCV